MEIMPTISSPQLLASPVRYYRSRSHFPRSWILAFALHISATARLCFDNIRSFPSAHYLHYKSYLYDKKAHICETTILEHVQTEKSRNHPMCYIHLNSDSSSRDNAATFTFFAHISFGNSISSALQCSTDGISRDKLLWRLS